MCTVDTDLLRETANILNRTGRDLVNCCNSDCRSILNELDRIASKYREYSSVISKVSAIRADINDILNLSRQLEERNQSLVSGLNNARQIYTEGEREAKAVVTQDKATACGKAGSRISDKIPTQIRNSSIKDIDIKSQEDAIKYVTDLGQNTEEIEMYTAILNNYRSSGQGEPQWVLDKLEELGAPHGVIKKNTETEDFPSYTEARGVTIRSEEDARKYVAQLEQKAKDIEMYTAILNNYRSSGQGQPQWVLDKLEELGAPYGVIEKAIFIDGFTLPKTNEIGQLRDKEADKYIKLLLKDLNGKVKDTYNSMALEFEGDLESEEDYNRAIELYIATKGYETSYELLGRIDKEDQKKVLLYWLILEKQGKEIKDTPMPKWWEERKEELIGKIEVTEENYEAKRAELYDYYRSYIYSIELVKSPERASHENFADWHMELYGHLDPNGRSIQRIKYKLAQAGIVDLKNEKGLYDNTRSKEYVAAIDLFLNLCGCYEEYYDKGDLLRRSNETYLIQKLEEVSNNEFELKYIRDAQIEKSIIEGKYTMLDNYWEGMDGKISMDGDTITLTATFQYMEDLDSVEERTVSHSFKLEYIEYAGKKYVDREAFEKAMREYVLKKGEAGYYKNQWINIWSDKELKKSASDLKNQIEATYPELKMTEGEVMTLLCQQIEMDKLMNPKKAINTELYQDATQNVLDALAVIAALTGLPIIAGAIELANIGISIYRYNYDDAALRSALLVADVIAGGFIDAAKAASKADDVIEVAVDPRIVNNVVDLKAVDNEIASTLFMDAKAVDNLVGAKAVDNLVGAKAVDNIEELNIFKGKTEPRISELDTKTMSKSVGESVNNIQEEVGNALKFSYDNIRAYRDIDVNLIPIEYRANPEQVIDMPFVGKDYAGTNSLGFKRDFNYFCEQSIKQNPELWSLENIARVRGEVVDEFGNKLPPIIDAQMVNNMPQYKDYIGESFVHHHIAQGGQAMIIPTSLHEGYGGIHNVEKMFGMGNIEVTISERLNAIKEATERTMLWNKTTVKLE